MGVEPIRVSSKDFESFVSTCFTTEAYKNFKKKTVEVLLVGYAGFEPAESRSQNCQYSIHLVSDAGFEPAECRIQSTMTYLLSNRNYLQLVLYKTYNHLLDFGLPNASTN